ncbi:MAG: SPOR domain-containing protein [Dongiaceae bacterium]
MPEPTATQEAAVTPAPTGNARVQLAASKSEAAVQKEWVRLRKAHPDLLGGLSLTIQRVDKGADGVFYRLQAGPLADKTAAKQLCASLKQQNQDCIVAK